MSDRKSMSKKTRFDVFKRDSFTCQYCGAKAPDVVLQVDHIEPVASGGSDSLLNLLTSCAACNGGKGARRLDDQSAVEKQRRQIEELQEKRDQIDMMVAWQKGLSNIDDHATEQLKEYWSELVPGWFLNEHGTTELRKMIKKFGLQNVMDAMRSATSEHVVLEGNPPKATKASVDQAWSYVGRIAVVIKRSEGKPHLRELYKIRARMRGWYSWIDERDALELLERAYDAGVSIEDLQGLITHHRSFNAWRSNIETWISGGETAKT